MGVLLFTFAIVSFQSPATKTATKTQGSDNATAVAAVFAAAEAGADANSPTTRARQGAASDGGEAHATPASNVAQQRAETARRNLRLLAEAKVHSTKI